MSKAKVKLGLKSLTAAEKIALARRIVAAMNEEPAVFPSPVPPLSALGDQAMALQGALEHQSAVQEQGKQATLQVMGVEGALDQGLTQIGSYIDLIANGNPLIIAKSGADEQAPPGPSHPMTQLQHVSVTTGDVPGELHVQYDPMANAKSYVWEVTSDPNPQTAQWTQVGIFTASRINIEGLDPRTYYFVRGAAIGALGQGPWSDPIQKLSA